MTGKCGTARVWMIGIVCVMLGAVVPGPCPAGQALDLEVAAAVAEALLKADINWSVRSHDGRTFLEYVQFGLPESYLKDLFRKYPEQKDGPWTVKDLFLERIGANGSQVEMAIGGVMKYKPNQFFQASGNFVVPAHLTFDAAKRQIHFRIESRFEKLKTKQFNIDVKKAGNAIMGRLKAGDQVKIIQADQLFRQMDLFRLAFTRFSTAGGFVYVTAAPKTPLSVSENVLAALKALKQGDLLKVQSLLGTTLGQ